MRKISILLFIFVISASALHAQKKSLGKKHLDWGLKTGINFSTLNSDAYISADWKSGFVAGAFFRIKAGKDFSVQPEFVYSAMGAKIADLEGESKYRLNYFSIPVLAKYKFAKKLAAVAGPQFDFLIQAKKVNDGAYQVTTDTYNDHSINLTGGLEFWPINKIGFGARYIHGLTDISKNGNSVANTVSIKNQGVQVTVAVKL